jgi:hypothetical protein
VDKNLKHELIAKALAACQKKVFDRRPELKVEFETKAMEEYESSTSVELRKKELEHRLYHLVMATMSEGSSLDSALSTYV